MQSQTLANVFDKIIANQSFQSNVNRSNTFDVMQPIILYTYTT